MRYVPSGRAISSAWAPTCPAPPPSARHDAAYQRARTTCNGRRWNDGGRRTAATGSEPRQGSDARRPSLPRVAARLASFSLLKAGDNRPWRPVASCRPGAARADAGPETGRALGGTRPEPHAGARTAGREDDGGGGEREVSGRGTSTMRPRSRTTILSAFCTVDSRCAITMVVRRCPPAPAAPPPSPTSRSSASCTTCSLLVSSACPRPTPPPYLSPSRPPTHAGAGGGTHGTPGTAVAT